MKHGLTALLLAGLTMPALAQSDLPTSTDIDKAYQQAVDQDEDARKDPMFRAMLASVSISEVYGCQPREDGALSCLVDMKGGLKPNAKASIMALSHSDAGWTLLKERTREFPAPSPQALAGVLKNFADAKIAEGAKDPQLTAASTGKLQILEIAPCTLDTSITTEEDGSRHRDVGVRCDVTLKPDADAQPVKTEMQLTPVGKGWEFGSRQVDAI